MNSRLTHVSVALQFFEQLAVHVLFIRQRDYWWRHAAGSILVATLNRAKFGEELDGLSSNSLRGPG